MSKSLSNEEVKSIVKDEINKFFKDSLDREINKILSSKSSLTRKEMIETIKNSLENVYKNLWVKRDFWKSDIK